MGGGCDKEGKYGLLVKDVKYKMYDTKCKMQDARCKMQDARC